MKPYQLAAFAVVFGFCIAGCERSEPDNLPDTSEGYLIIAISDSLDGKGEFTALKDGKLPGRQGGYITGAE